MPALRQRKRPASPTNDAAPDPPKKQPKKGKGKATAPPITISDDDDAAPPPLKKTASKPKRKANKTEPQSDEDTPAAAATSTDQGNGNVDEDETLAVSGAQYAKDGALSIPLDEGCSSQLPNYSVHIDDSDGIIYDASLNQTNSGDNANKFYRVQLVTDGKAFKVWTRWGRVGERGQSMVLGDGSLDNGLKEFDKKFKAKSGLAWADRGKPAKAGKYVFVERSYEPDSEPESDEEDDRAAAAAGKPNRSRSASPAKCSLEKPVQSLMELIFNQQYMVSTMADMNYDSKKLPLGKLSKATITRGYRALKALAELLNDPTLAQSEHNTTVHQATETLSNEYYSYIPHAFGRNRPPVIASHQQLKKEVELLESLTDLKDADQILKADKGSATVHPLDARYDGLGMREMMPVDRNSGEFSNISEYLMNTRGMTHGINYEVLDVFRIERTGEADRFQAFKTGKSNRRLLWHGSRSTNYAGILSQGLRIAPPEAPVSGYMFGKGIYLADMSSKSANYCAHYNSGGHALLMLCEAELGSPMQELIHASSTAGDDAKAKGLYSTWGQGLVGPLGWKDAECIHPSLAGVMMPDTTKPPGDTNVLDAYLQYNEYIAYDVNQVRLRYLLRVKM